MVGVAIFLIRGDRGGVRNCQDKDGGASSHVTSQRLNPLLYTADGCDNL